ncbi:GMC oxidoreductase [Bradyrhizobium sp. MOS002]|uniref:GMC oxidoreductase n=1 Tax=Bradyrhizobium sp. MOS002 TaxID=2133947 RepID=UPI000D12279E|nr:GMC family oxidoreductase [Bradyrhizobium sp. MOS002]PSO25975.1 hypothetical protein C7G41_28765 [Bradyrhizobium sp. MOS002]
MIRDLSGSIVALDERSADVLVIGAGIAGLLVATRLAQNGIRVLVAESGGRTQEEEKHPFNQVEQLGDTYLGAEHGRFRCLGGTSTRWGGAMLPFQEVDLDPHSAGWDIEWPIKLDALTSYQAELERMFGLNSGEYDFPDLLLDATGAPSSFMGRLAKWPAFRHRNVANLLANDIRSEKGPIIWLNATATEFHFDPASRFIRTRLQSRNGNALEVTARETVITAGAIESTRLLLLADRQHDNRIFAPHNMLGRYFYDHLSSPTARLTGMRKKALNRLVGFRFEGSTMRNLRFEPTADLRHRQGYPAGFLHIAFSETRPGGFDAVRRVYRKLQKGGTPTASEMMDLARGAPWLLKAAWWRFVEKRLLFPEGAELDVHTVIEQEPRAENRISLSQKRLDEFGCPLATLHWHVSENDGRNAYALTKAFVVTWNRGSLSHLAQVELRTTEDELRTSLKLGGGIFHPGGTIRMGADASRGVVDPEFRTFGVSNLSVISTAIFPTGGGANPTMMLMMAALRAADRLIQQSRRVQ